MGSSNQQLNQSENVAASAWPLNMFANMNVVRKLFTAAWKLSLAPPMIGEDNKQCLGLTNSKMFYSR